MKDLVSENIRKIIPYPPGKPIEEVEREYGLSGSIKLASNENPLGPSSKAVEALREGITKIGRYPDGSGYYLKRALSQKLKVETENIILGNGSNEIIELLVRTFLSAGEEAIIADQAFVIYRMVTQAVDGRNIIVPLKNFTHDLISMAAKVTSRTKIIFIANPNNPTGTIVTKREMDEFMEKIPKDIIIVVDEAYFEYVAEKDFPDMLSYLQDERNVIILRTFSKMYGLAGLRIGYGIAKKEIIEYMNKIRQPFNCNSLAQMAALAALNDEEHVKKSREINEQGKSFLYTQFKSLNLSYIPSVANFILVDLERDVADIYIELLKRGIIVRPMAGYGLKNYIRVTIGLPEENRRFIEGLKEVMGK